jgi:hypothetical protein
VYIKNTKNRASKSNGQLSPLPSAEREEKEENRK